MPRPPPDLEFGDFSWAVAVPLVKTEYTASLPEAVRSSVKKFNNDHYETAEPKRMWLALAEGLKTIIP